MTLDYPDLNSLSLNVLKFGMHSGDGKPDFLNCTLVNGVNPTRLSPKTIMFIQNKSQLE